MYIKSNANNVFRLWNCVLAFDICRFNLSIFLLPLFLSMNCWANIIFHRKKLIQFIFTRTNQKTTHTQRESLGRDALQLSPIDFILYNIDDTHFPHLTSPIYLFENKNEWRNFYFIPMKLHNIQIFFFFPLYMSACDEEGKIFF